MTPNRKWRAHAIALAVWAVPPTIFGVLMELRSQWLRLGLGFTIPYCIALWSIVALPTTSVVALRRSAGEGFVIGLHAVLFFLFLMTLWFMQG